MKYTCGSCGYVYDPDLGDPDSGIAPGIAFEDLPEDSFPARHWGKGNNPKTAVSEYLKTHPEFETDKSIDHKLLISVAPDGYLKRLI